MYKYGFCLKNDNQDGRKADLAVEPYARHSRSPTVLVGISVSQCEIVCAYSITFCWRKNSHPQG